MLKLVVIPFLVTSLIAVCVIALTALKPARFNLQRSITIQAAREKVFSLISDLHRWPEWSENERTNAKLQLSYSGAWAGKGAVCEWEGGSGKVRLEILESSPTIIRVQADWTKPFKARNINIFRLESQGTGDATRVTWTLDGENVFVLKLVTVFTSADRLMGSHFEKGLANLKAAAEE
jgi:uncharacterized protein YndB with AHSA1/START domain